MVRLYGCCFAAYCRPVGGRQRSTFTTGLGRFVQQLTRLERIQLTVIMQPECTFP